MNEMKNYLIFDILSSLRNIVAKNKNVIVEKNKRITAKHIREMQEMGIKQLDVPEDFLLGRALAQHIVDKETGEVVA